MTLISKKDPISEDVENMVNELVYNYDHDSINEYMGTQIRKYRKAANLKQQDLAAFLRLSRASVINLEMGRHRFSSNNIWLLCCALNCQVGDLFPPTRQITITETEEEIQVVKVKIVKARKIEFKDESI